MDVASVSLPAPNKVRAFRTVSVCWRFFCFAEFEFPLHFEEGVGDSGILANRGESLTRKIDGVGQLLAIHHSLDFAETLFQAVRAFPFHFVLSWRARGE